jgi:digeranylgeranylglycerophospholipid reductase
MKVAIIGAGVSGLACAHELERHGIKPVIYEDTDFIGDREPHITANLQIVDRPIKDMIKFINKKFDIQIKPINTIRKITHLAPDKKSVVEGDNLGYLFLRGKEEDSLKGQLYSMLKKTKIIFSIKPDYTKLAKENDYVVVANGLSDISKELGCWETLIDGWIKGAVVSGDFNVNELIMWIDTTYCKNGYAYLTAYNNKKASLILFVPKVNEKEVDYFWNKFITSEKIKYTIHEEFKIKHSSGYVYPHKLDNIYLIGTAGGALSPFLGFGQTNCIIMGALAAQSIVKGSDYEKLIKFIVEKEAAMYEFRKSFDKLTNSNYNTLVTSIGLPGVKHLLYYTNQNITKYGAKALKLKHKLLKK